MKVKLRCTDCLNDVSNVTSVLSRHNINIVKTKYKSSSINAIITCVFNKEQELNEVLYDINQNSKYGVSVMSKNNDDSSNIFYMCAIASFCSFIICVIAEILKLPIWVSISISITLGTAIGRIFSYFKNKPK